MKVEEPKHESGKFHEGVALQGRMKNEERPLNDIYFPSTSSDKQLAIPGILLYQFSPWDKTCRSCNSRNECDSAICEKASSRGNKKPRECL